MTTRFRKILVALKPGQEGLPLSAHHARLLAQGLGAELRLMSCVYESQVAAQLAGDDPQAFGAKTGLLGAERERLEGLARSLADWGVGVSVSARWGHPMQDVVVAEARDWGADVLVVGAHHERARIHLTDIDWRLMVHSPCPLLVVKDPNFSGYPSILAGVDPLHRHAEPSGLDDAVLEAACALAEAFDARLSVVHAYPPPEAFELASAVEVAPGVLYGSENVEEVHRRAVMDLIEAHGLNEAQACLEPGRAEDIILEQARERHARLLVLGAVKRGRLEHALLGSTAEKVAADLDCDLLLVRGKMN